MKKCFKCLCILPLDEFYKHAAMTDGRLNKCKSCTKKDVRRHRQENLEQIRAYDRLRGATPHRVAAIKEYAKTSAGKFSHAKAVSRQREINPKKAKARNAVSNAIRDGKLIRQPCFVCGRKSEAHHPDYDRPLDVVWLCTSHHKQAHALFRNIKESSC